MNGWKWLPLAVLVFVFTSSAEEKTTVEVKSGTVRVKSSAGEANVQAGETVVVDGQKLVKKSEPTTVSDSYTSVTINGKTIEVLGTSKNDLRVHNGKITIQCGETTITGDTLALKAGGKTYDISSTDRVSITVNGERVVVDTTGGAQRKANRKPLPDARVLAVRPEMDLVMLSVGTKTGAEPGNRLTISRGGQPVAKAEIQKVYTDMSSARLVLKKVDVQVNDLATFRLVPAKTPPFPHPDPALAKRIKTLIAQLGADEFALRDDAHKELTEIGEKALRPLSEAQANLDDPEIRSRCQKLIEEIREKWLLRLDREQIQKREPAVTPPQVDPKF